MHWSTSLASRSATVGGRLLSEAFRVTAAVRGSRPLHPKGGLLTGVLSTDGQSQLTGVPWVDDADEIVCEARLSRAVGLSAALPDIQGLALRWYCQGELCDLLFAGTGLSRAGRFVLTPRRALLAGPMTTLFPLRSANGPLLFAATPTPDAPPGADPEHLAEQATISPIVLTLAHATPTGEWTPFGRLRLTGPHDAASTDPVIRFAPVDATPVGLQQYEFITRLRGQSYAGARAGFSGGAAVAP